MRVRAIALFVGALAACSAQRGATRDLRVAPGVRAPDFTANRLDQGHMALNSLLGQVVVLNVWAAWCVGCEEDLPLLDAMAVRLEGDVKVVAVSLDSSRVRIAPIANSRAWRLTMLHDPTGRVGDLYQPSSLPALYLIDRSGIVRHSYVGVRADQLDGIERQARALSQ